MVDTSIELFIERCRRRLLAWELVAAVLWAVAGLALVLVAALALATEWAPALRITLLVGAAGWLLWLAWLWLKRRDRVALARELEMRLCGSRRLEWASALELPCPGTSVDLARVFRDCVEKKIKAGFPGRLYRPQQLLPPLTALLVLGGAFALAAVSYPARLAAVGRLFSLSSAETSTGPGWVGDIRLRLQYPDYTGYEAVDIEGSDGTIRALAGTRVTIAARADRELRAGSILYNQRRIPLNLSGERRIEGELLAGEAGDWRFELVDSRGRRWSQPRPYPVILDADAPPQVELLRPESDGQLQNQQLLSLAYQAADDFGLSEVRLVWRIAGRAGGEQRRVLWTGQARRLARESTLDLAAWRLGEEERLQFFLEACDNDTVNGPKCSRSAARAFSLFSPEKKKLEMLQLVQAFWEKLLLQLADSLEILAEDKSPPEISRLENLNRAAGQLLESLDRIVLDLSRAGPDLASLRASLGNLAQRLRRERGRLEELLARPTDSRNVSRLREHIDQRVATLEKDVLYLESLLDLLRLEQLDKLAERIRAARDLLEQLLREYLQAPSLEARERLEQQIAELKETIRQLQQRQREVLKGVQDQYLNPEALARLMQDSDLGGALERLQEMIHQGRMQEALQELERMRDQLQRLDQQLRESRSRLAGGRWRELAEQMSRALAELGRIAAEQQAVLEETQQLQRSLLEGLQRQYRQQMAAALEGLKKRLGEIEKNLDRLAARLGPLQPVDLMDQGRQNARLLRAALEQFDLQAARSAARELVRDSAELELRLSLYSAPERNQNEKLAGQIAGESRRLLQDLEKLLPQEAELAAPLAGRLKALGERQKQALDRLRQLEQQAEKLNRQAPLFGPGALGRLAAGGGEMQGALVELDRRRPSRATGHQQKALDQLRALEKELQQSCESGEKGGLPLPLGGLAGADDWGYGPRGERPDISEVEIPSPQEFRPPEELRRKLLEGMKDPVPENYRQQVRAYYQELVK